MSVDLGLVVGRGVTSMSCSNNVVTVVYSDGTSSTFNLNNNIGNFSFIESKTSNGLTIRVYSDGLYVFVKLNGTITKTFSNHLALSTGFDTDYMPPTSMYARCHADGDRDITFRLTANGAADLYANGTTTSKPELAGSMMYPLASRMP